MGQFKVTFAKGFLNTEDALKIPISPEWLAMPNTFHPGCSGIVRQSPHNQLVQGCDGCGRVEVYCWRPEFREC